MSRPRPGAARPALAGAGALLALSVAGTAAAGALTRSWTASAGGCVVALEEYGGADLVLRVRSPGEGIARPCPLEAAALAAALEGLLAQAAPAPGPDGAFTLGMGRAVHLPGLSAGLGEAATASAAWDAGAGRPRSGAAETFVREALAASPALRGLFPRHELVGVSVEKVLVPTARAVRERVPGGEVPAARVPYDAMLWVRLRRR